MDSPNDSLEISLLTCEPHQNVYSLYGHSAIHVRNHSNGVDVVVNYGMFSFDKPFFILRFVFGLTDYYMAIEPYDYFCEQYFSYGSGVFEQVLNLNSEEKSKIVRALEENYRPENRIYRYNYFYDNCTTRARDILLKQLNGKIVFPAHQHNEKATFRKLIHNCNYEHPWAAFGNDLLLGYQADLTIDDKDMQFIPGNLKADFDQALFIKSGEQPRKLIKVGRWIVPKQKQIVEKEFLIAPFTTCLIIGFLIISISVCELFIKRYIFLLDYLLLPVCGILGIILLAMVFSKHPTVNVNFQIFLFNPLLLPYFHRLISQMRRHERSKLMILWIGSLTFGIIGSLIQNYAEGIQFLAFFLLLRYTLLYFRNNRIRINK